VDDDGGVESVGRPRDAVRAARRVRPAAGRSAYVFGHPGVIAT
jgi:hypothetical protein